MTNGWLHLQGWHGKSKHPVEIIGETPKRIRVRMCEKVNLPSRRVADVGAVVLVPKYAVTERQ